jgi:hypothetical protein
MENCLPSHPSVACTRRQKLMIGPSWWMCPRVAIIVVAASLLTLASHTAGAGEDPLEWRPPASKPHFRKLLSDADYQRLSTPIMARVPQAMKEAATKLPDHGLKISGVFAPGALESQGVTLNDVITAVDGEELWGRYSQSEEKPIRVRVYSARQNRFRELQVTTDLGFAFSIDRRPDLAYLRSKDRNSRWDRDTFVGLVTASSDPNLAETAWHRALAAGSPRSRLCLASGAQLALAQGRLEAALDFWYEAEHYGGSEPLDPLLGYRVMIANHKLEQARDLARKHSKLLPNIADGLAALVALHRARTPQQRAMPAPSVQARGMYRRDARRDLIGLSPTAEDTFLERLMKRDMFHASPSSDHFVVINFQLARGLGDFELGLALTIAPSDKLRAGFVKLARLDLSGVRKTDGLERTESTLIGHVELEVPSGFSLRTCEPGDDVYFLDPRVVADGKKRNAIRFSRVGGQLEVFVNERRVVYQPILPDVQLQTIQFQVVGASIDVSEFTLDELIPRL